MALPTLALVLKPAADNKQRISDPNGEYVVSVAPVTNLRVAAKTDTTMRISWDYPTGTDVVGFNIEQSIGQPATWSPVATVGVSTKTWSATGLPPNRYIGHRVNAYNNT